MKKTHLLRKTRYSLNDEFSGFLKFQEILQTDQDATLTTRKRSQSATLLGPLCDETFCHLIAPFNKNQPINRKIRKKKHLFTPNRKRQKPEVLVQLVIPRLLPRAKVTLRAFASTTRWVSTQK